MDAGRSFAEVEEADRAFTRSTREDMNSQRTLRRPVSCTGIGLHSGNKVTLSLKPAPADYGIRFQRSDLGGLEIPATVTNLGGIQYATAKMNEYQALAFDLLGTFPDNTYRQSLKELVRFTTERKY